MQLSRQLARQLYVSRCRRPVPVPRARVLEELLPTDRIIIIRVDGPEAIIYNIDDVVRSRAAQQ